MWVPWCNLDVRVCTENPLFLRIPISRFPARPPRTSVQGQRPSGERFATPADRERILCRCVVRMVEKRRKKKEEEEKIKREKERKRRKERYAPRRVITSPQRRRYDARPLLIDVSIRDRNRI